MNTYAVPSINKEGLATFLAQAPEMDPIARLNYFYSVFPYADQLPGSLVVLDRNCRTLACNEYAWKQVELEGIHAVLDKTSLEIEQHLGWPESIAGQALQHDQRVLEIGESIYQETIFNGGIESLLVCKKEAIYADNQIPMGLLCLALPILVKHKKIHWDSVQNHYHVYLTPERPIILTPREFCVLQESLKGNSVSIISTALQISIKTVETYFMRIKDKLGCQKQREIFPILVKSDIVNSILDQKIS